MNEKLVPPIVRLSRRLLEQEQSLYLGRSHRGVQFGGVEDNALILGPTRTGKTSGLIIPSVAAHPGPVLITSTRPDIVAATLRSRTAIAETYGGRVVSVAFDETRESESEIAKWSVTDGCDDWNTALDRAAVLVQTAMPGTSDAFWRDTASDILAGCLMAASFLGDTDQMMSARIRSGDLSDYHNFLLDQCPAGHPATYALNSLFEESVMAEDTRRSVFATISSQILGQFRYSIEATGRSINLADFCRSWGTIYLTVRPERTKSLRPIVAAFVEAVTGAWRATSQRPAGTLLLALDEVHNVAPLPNLPAILTAGSGDGIQCLLGLHEPGQADRWGDESTIVTGASTHIEIFGGLRNSEYLNSLSELMRREVQYDLRVEVLPGTPAGTRYADEAQLIQERLELEQARQNVEPRLAKFAARRACRSLATERLRHGTLNRIDDAQSASEAVMTELLKYTRVQQVSQRRSSIEPEQISNQPPGGFLHYSRFGSEFRTARPWVFDGFWRAAMA